MNYNQDHKKRYSRLIKAVTGFENLSWYRNVHAKRILKNKGRYLAISAELGLPPALIPCLETREMGPFTGKFSRYLGNGQSLSKKTTIVPKNRGPFLTWEDGVRDAIKLTGLDKVEHWTLERFLFECEKYNGFGYYYRSKPSSYVWSFTKPHSSRTGLFVSDGVYNPNANDKNIGIYAMYEVLSELDSDFKITSKPIEKPVEEESFNFVDFIVGLFKEFLAYFQKNAKATEPTTSLEDRIIENNNSLPRAGVKNLISWLGNQNIRNKDHAILADMEKSSKSKRFHVINLHTGETVVSTKVAHGKKSDPDHDGYTNSYSNVSGSHKSSIGAMYTGAHYGKKNSGWSKFDYSTFLYGLEDGINDNVKSRAIVFHSSKYVDHTTNAISGRSLGCFAVDDDIAQKIQSYMKEGTLLYAYDSRFI